MWREGGKVGRGRVGQKRVCETHRLESSPLPSLPSSQDVTCISFDYNLYDLTGWMHRVSHDCAEEAGGVFLRDETGSVFYEKKPQFRGMQEKEWQVCVLIASFLIGL